MLPLRDGPDGATRAAVEPVLGDRLLIADGPAGVIALDRSGDDGSRVWIRVSD